MKAGKLMLAAAAAGAAMAATATVPTVSNVTMTQTANTRLVTITYNLADEPAVITLDVQTNATANAAADDPGWASIGGDGVWNAMGDVWKKVDTGSHTITWRPDVAWPDHKIEDNCARAVVTAWATNNTPAYMVVNLALDKTDEDFLKFYPGEAYLPKSSGDQAGKAITGNPEYKTNKLVMRKIMAAGVTWTMGSGSTEAGRNSGNEYAHEVTLTDNYYIGVFPVTQYQWSLSGVSSSNYAYQCTPQFTAENAMRPVESIAGNYIRKRGYKTVPDSGMFIGKLRAATGISFDLPFETQWEFAARAGWGSGFWGNGKPIQAGDANGALAALGRFGQTYSSDGTVLPAEGGTPIVGSYEPNDWGLYDMFGCVRQACIDKYNEDTRNLSDSNIDGGNGNVLRVTRGGAWCDTWDKCRPAARDSHEDAPNQNTMNSKYKGRVGFRLVCPVGI